MNEQVNVCMKHWEVGGIVIVAATHKVAYNRSTDVTGRAAPVDN
jgi:hypothetical protein